MAVDLNDPAELWLIRHAESVGNLEERYQGHEDMPLTARGRAQALRLAQRLRWEMQTNPFSAIYSSDLSRSLETARPAAEALGLPVRSDRRLREIDVGEWSGLTYAEIADGWPDQWEASRSEMDPAVARGGGETYAEAQRRIVSLCAELVAQHAHQRVLIFFHGGVLRALLVHLLGMSLRNLRRFVTDNASIHRLQVGHSRADGALVGVIHGLNDTIHLAESDWRPIHQRATGMDGTQPAAVERPESAVAVD